MKIATFELALDPGKYKYKCQCLEKLAEKFSPKFLLRTSLRNFVRHDNFLNIPLYAISNFYSYVKAKL